MRSESEIKVRKKQAVERSEKIGKHLYHYTSVAALYGMLSNKQFWWGNTATMNDTSEITDFVDRLKEAIIIDAAPDEPLLKDFFGKINARIKSEYPFAMCFSTAYDDAAQWERYADNAKGVCVAFNTETFLELLYFNQVLTNEIFYKGDIRNHAHYRIVKHYFETGELIEGFHDINGLMDNIILCASTHKHESFSSEYEFRSLSLQSYIIKHLAKNCSEISFELIGGQIKKVLKVNYEQLCQKEGLNVEDLFESVTIAPKSGQSENDLKEFCLKNGFEKLAKNISVSKCPLRCK